MKRWLITAVWILGLVTTAAAQEKVKTYQLQQHTAKSRINQSALKKLAKDQLRTSSAITSAFSSSRQGKSDTYFFIATYQGNSFDGTVKTFHDYLVLQVDPTTQRIEDGYQYTLEWTDSSRIDLYRINNANAVLTDSLPIETLDFRCFYLLSTDFRYHLNETGLIKLP